MNQTVIRSETAILLVGGGFSNPELLTDLTQSCDTRVAADGGAARLLAAGILPDAVIGDLDSLADEARTQIPADRIHHVTEQDSTDFDKCLRSIDAPLVFGTGFLDPRIDHGLGALTVLARHPDRRCILIGAEDAVMLAPPRLSLALPKGCRVSLWPLGPVTGRSTGLRWPIDGLHFTPDDITGTSNEATGPVTLEMDGPRMLLILPLEALWALRQALASAPAEWPARAG